MNRISSALRVATLAVALLSLSACFDETLVGGGRTVNVVLLDRSGSIPETDRDIYARSIAAIGEDVEAGDKVMVAEIGDASRSSFRTLLEVEAEDSDVRLKRESNLRKARKALSEAMPTLLPEEAGKGASSTRILEAISAASEAFRVDARGRLFILSDAVEESQVVNLARMPRGTEAFSAALERAGAEGLLPDLEGVELFIIGAGGDETAMGVEGIRQFWDHYAQATGATLVKIGRLPHESS